MIYCSKLVVDSYSEIAVATESRIYTSYDSQVYLNLFCISIIIDVESMLKTLCLSVLIRPKIFQTKNSWNHLLFVHVLNEQCLSCLIFLLIEVYKCVCMNLITYVPLFWKWALACRFLPRFLLKIPHLIWVWLLKGDCVGVRSYRCLDYLFLKLVATIFP